MAKDKQLIAQAQLDIDGKVDGTGWHNRDHRAGAGALSGKIASTFTTASLYRCRNQLAG